MDGKDALRRLRELLDEESTGTWLDDRTSYDYLWEAAKEFSMRTKALTKTHRIETSSDVEEYALPYDFGGLYLKDRYNRFYVKFNNSAGDQFVKFKDLEDIEYENYTRTYDLKQGTVSYPTTTTFKDTTQDFRDWDTTSSTDPTYKIVVHQNDGTERWGYIGPANGGPGTADIYKLKSMKALGWNGDSAGTASYYEVQNTSGQSVPSHFTIRDKQTLYSQITGSESHHLARSNGDVVLADRNGAFLTTDYISPGDIIHNTTDGSDGVVLNIANATQCTIALFGGTNNYTATDDSYVIQPQGRQELLFEPPPNTSNHLVSVNYLSLPDPVYSNYGTYRFSQKGMEAIIKYAAWMYKYRDSEPDFGDMLYRMFDMETRDYSERFRPRLRKRGYGVNMKVRRYH